VSNKKARQVKPAGRCCSNALVKYLEHGPMQEVVMMQGVHEKSV
jgi:hypothetical protein